MDFHDPHAHGFVKVACVSPVLSLADPLSNARVMASCAADLCAADLCAADLCGVDLCGASGDGASGGGLSDSGLSVVLFPQLGISGASCGDLFNTPALVDACQLAVEHLCEATRNLSAVLIVGCPIRLWQGTLLNCAVVLQRGKILGLSAQVNPGVDPLCAKYFAAASAAGLRAGGGMKFLPKWAGQSRVPLGAAVRLDIPLVGGLAQTSGGPASVYLPQERVFSVGIAVGRDLYCPELSTIYGSVHALAHLDATPSAIGSALPAADTPMGVSERLGKIVLSANPGWGESSDDLSWQAQARILQCGKYKCGKELLPAANDSQNFQVKPLVNMQMVDLCSVDFPREATLVLQPECPQPESQQSELAGAPSAQVSFASEPSSNRPCLEVGRILCDAIRAEMPRTDSPLYVSHRPFVDLLEGSVLEAFNMQVRALVNRMRAVVNPRLVLGVSGGLDSALALLVCRGACNVLGLEPSNIAAYTMPGFGTTDHTKSNALALCQALNIPCQTLDIRPAALQMLKDLGHGAGSGKEEYDITFENVQAGLRTDYLFRLANKLGGFVVGTGDMSEMALGWCTYGVGDHMSHYGVNAGLPKTCVQFMVRSFADAFSGQAFNRQENTDTAIAHMALNHWGLSQQDTQKAGSVLASICETEISPELIPIKAGNAGQDSKEGQGVQSTQKTIGPYILHDFFLYHTLMGNSSVSRIAFLADCAFNPQNAGANTGANTDPEQGADGQQTFTLPQILRWMRVFYERFITQQFKRSVSVGAPRIFSMPSLSPRGDWMAPPDASANSIRAQVDALIEHFKDPD